MALESQSDSVHRPPSVLSEGEAQFREMADTAPVMLWRSRADKLCDWFNKTWLDFTGRTMEQEFGNGWTEAIHPDDLDHCLHIYVAAFDASQKFSMEYRLRRHDGQFRWVLDTGTPRLSKSGELLGYFGSCIDIHDRKLAEQERDRLLAGEQAMRVEAERANRMKDEFLSVVSHELRTPLNAILGWSQLLGTGKMSDEELKEGLDVIQRNARVQTQIIEDILDMGRIMSGKVRLDVQRVDLPTVIEAANDSMQPAAKAKGIRLHTVLDPLAGPVSGDPARLQQIVWNLLSNAIKFTPRGGRVRVTLERVNSHVEISVSDTGEGIAPEFLPYIFERFRQADGATTRRHGGLGLGLSIVKQLAELHGGTVQAKSPGINQGTTFRVALPLTPLQADEEPARQHPRSQPMDAIECDAPMLKGVKVLVVDDEPDARNLLKRLLEDCEAHVTTGQSVDEGAPVDRGGTLPRDRQ